MNKNILFVLGLIWFLVGCSQAPIAPASSPLAGCKKQASWFCRGNSQAPTVTLNTQVRKLKASPYCVRAEKGTQLIFRLTPPGNKALNAVEIIPKDPGDNWLEAKNSTFQDLIIIDVPPDLDESKRYYYGIKTDTDCVDPRIHVEY